MYFRGFRIELVTATSFRMQTYRAWRAANHDIGQSLWNEPGVGLDTPKKHDIHHSSCRGCGRSLVQWRFPPWIVQDIVCISNCAMPMVTLGIHLYKARNDCY